MKFCPKCQKPNESNYLVCPQCGHKFLNINLLVFKICLVLEFLTLIFDIIAGIISPEFAPTAVLVLIAVIFMIICTVPSIFIYKMHINSGAPLRLVFTAIGMFLTFGISSQNISLYLNDKSDFGYYFIGIVSVFNSYIYKNYT